jgi:hypothetical protein
MCNRGFKSLPQPQLIGFVRRIRRQPTRGQRRYSRIDPKIPHRYIFRIDNTTNDTKVKQKVSLSGALRPY